MKKMVCLMILLLLLSTSCSKIFFFTINNKKTFINCNQCGNILINAYALNSSLYIFFTFDGNYTINFDDFTVIPIDKEAVQWNVHKEFFISNNESNRKKIFENKISVKENNLLEIRFSLPRGQTEFFLLPSNFIECDDNSFLPDSLHIQLRK